MTTGLVPSLAMSPALQRQILGCIQPEGNRFRFHLTEPLILGIFHSRDRGHTLDLPKPLQQTLRKAALWDTDSETDSETDSARDAEGDGASSVPVAQSGLTFLTEYQGQLVLESIVGLDGDILYRVKRDLLREEQCLAVVTAHNWLVDQMLGSLRSQMEVPEAVSWTLALLPTGISLTVALAHGEWQTLVLPTLTGVGTPWLKTQLQVGLQRLAPQLQAWILSQVANPSPPVRWLSDRIMNRFQ